MTDLTQAWGNFFVAEVGASAALTGLVFVAVSINLERILQFPHLPGLALEALADFAVVLVVSSLGLVPSQPRWLLELELLGVGLMASAWQLLAFIRKFRTGRRYGGFLLRSTFSQTPPLCFVVAGVVLSRGSEAGIYWLVPGTLLSFAAGLAGAWVLLIEIHR